MDGFISTTFTLRSKKGRFIPELFKNKSFFALWMSQLISALGDRFTQMGMMTFIMIASQDRGGKMALIAFFSLLPFLLFGPLFGTLVDRYSRKNLMLFADVFRAILVAFIPIIWMSTQSVILIIVWFFMLGCFTALFSPANMSILTNIVEKEDLLEANSLIMTTGIGATLVGTFLAGAAIKIAGVRSVFFINCLTYLISAFFIFRIIYKKSDRTDIISENRYQTFINDIWISINYIRKRRLIVRLLLLNGMFSFVSSFAYILILNYGALALRQDSLGMGALLFCTGFGMITGSLILLKRKGKVNYKKALYLSYLIIGFFYSIFFFGPSFYLTLAILICAGIGVSILAIILDSIFQRIIPDDLKGKVFAVRGILTNGIFLSSLLLAGFLIKFLSPSTLFVMTGFVGILTSVNIFFYRKQKIHVPGTEELMQRWAGRSNGRASPTDSKFG